MNRVNGSMAANVTADVEDRMRPALPHSLTLAWFALFTVCLVLIAGIAVFGRARDGDPVATLDLDWAAPQRAATLQKGIAPAAKTNTNLIGAGPQPTASLGSRASATGVSSRETVPPPPLPPQVVPGKIDKPVYAGSALVADPALIEMTEQGPLPRIADDGRTPMTAYAPPATAARGPRIVLVVGGLGISAKATAAAIANLPAGVTLSFAPYADDVQRWVGEARRRGHEVLLEVPMEPYDFPDSDPGPHTLRAAVSEESNTERLAWSLTRFTGYVGVTNLLGGRFLADPDALGPVMTYLARRGLLFFDSGPQSRSAAPDLARQTNAPYVRSAVTIDDIQTSMEIDQRLSELETRARQNGSAAGSAFVYPVTMERVANWAAGLSGRGFVLVPASAIVTSSK
jgi:polysaccharide deacetylase 2 family uncharacterized protein YibQ